MESLACQKHSSSTTSTNSQVKNEFHTTGYQHSNCKSVLAPEINFHQDIRIKQILELGTPKLHS